ncbi:MAG: hypothetical protein QW620_06780 [Thermoplasmata archaeon]
MPAGPEVSLETDFEKVSAKREKVVKKENAQKEYHIRIKENILRMFETKN